jgi:hypothetical protein
MAHLSGNGILYMLTHAYVMCTTRRLASEDVTEPVIMVDEYRNAMAATRRHLLMHAVDLPTGAALSKCSLYVPTRT